MERDVFEYVAACQVCTQNKNSNQAVSGLQDFQVPTRPSTPISLDFVSGLSLSEGNTTVLTLVDRFSEMMHFFTLPKLPSAKEITELMLNQVFKLHGLPQMSHQIEVCNSSLNSGKPSAFCWMLPSVLFSGYHPQASGQTE